MKRLRVFRKLIASAALLGFSTFPLVPNANGAEPTAAELSDQAYARYEAADYSGAVALYMKAYSISVDSRILFNVAQIYDKKVQDRDLALEYYRRYLKSTTTEVDLVKKATERVTELQRQVDEPKPAQPQPTATASSAPQTSATGVAQGPTAAPAVTMVPTAQAASGPQVWIGYGVAGLFAAGAVVTGALALSASGDVSKGTFTGATPPSELNDSASNARTLGITTDILIGSAVVSAAVTLIVHLSSGKSEKPTAAATKTGRSPTKSAPAKAQFAPTPAGFSLRF